MTSPEQGLNIRGAVDLSALAAPAAEPVEGGYILEATAASFAQVVEQSQTVPVIVELYSARSQASAALSAVLQKLVEEYAGKFLLARVNADTEPDIVAAFGIQGVPTTLALVKTQPIPLFQGVHEEASIKQVLDDVLRVAAENGVTGTLSAEQEAQEDPEEEPLSPNIAAAYEAIEAQDYDGAIEAYRAELAINPTDAEAQAGIIQVELLKRLGDDDPAEVLAAADAAGVSALEANLRAADVEMSTGEYAAAFTRILSLIKAVSGEEREQARVRLVDLFQLAPEGSAEVAQARKDLALALF